MFRLIDPVLMVTIFWLIDPLQVHVHTRSLTEVYKGLR